MIKKIITATFWLSLLVNTSSSFAEHNAPQSRLHNINSKIAAIQSNISNDKHKLTEIQIKLKHVEIASAVVSKNLQTLSQKIASAQETLNALKAKQANMQQKLDTQLGLLSVQLSSNYELWREPYFKLLLNPNVEKVGHTYFIYYRYLNQARGDLVGNIKSLRDQVQRNVETQQRQYHALVTLQEKQVHKRLSKMSENSAKKSCPK